MARLLILLAFAGTALAQRYGTPEPVGLSSDPIQLAASSPPEWNFLLQTSVREDLKITAAQKAAMERLLGEIDLSTADAYSWLSLGMIPPGEFNRTFPRAQEQFLKAGLTPAQQQRLRQIIFQLKEREFGAHAAFTLAAKDLGLSGDQLEDVMSIRGQRVEEIAKLVTSGERFEMVKKKVEATNGDSFEKITEMLTRTQREKLNELRGKPFRSDVPPTTVPVKKLFGPVVPPAPKPKVEVLPPPRVVLVPPPYPRELFGLFDYELRYLGIEKYRDALGVPKDQVASIEKELESWNADYTEMRQKTEMIPSVIKFHDRTAQALAAVLTAKQLERFHQIMTQRRKALGGLEAACGYPPAAEKLKLSPIQFRDFKAGKPASEVLSKDDLLTLETLLGPASSLEPDDYYDPICAKFNTAMHPMEERGRFRIEDNPFRNVEVPAKEKLHAEYYLAIAERLGLSPDQIKRLQELAEDEPKVYELLRHELGFADTTPVTTRIQTSVAVLNQRYRAALETHCFNVLDEKQQSIANSIFARSK
jgi:hypothetical protein